jgi:soluble lytic murein transglycosylase-like protein
VRPRVAALLALLGAVARAEAVSAETPEEPEPPIEEAAVVEPAVEPVAAALGMLDLIIQAARRHGVPEAELLAVVWCESRFDPRAVNPRSGASGLFQFVPSTWRVASRAAGWAGASPFDPVAAADVGGYWYKRRPQDWSCRPTQRRVR